MVLDEKSTSSWSSMNMYHTSMKVKLPPLVVLKVTLVWAHPSGVVILPSANFKLHLLSVAPNLVHTRLSRSAVTSDIAGNSHPESINTDTYPEPLSCAIWTPRTIGHMVLFGLVYSSSLSMTSSGDNFWKPSTRSGCPRALRRAIVHRPALEQPSQTHPWPFT